jgi:mannose-6-phosphate isomerase
MGVHPEGPSELMDRGERISLPRLISRDPGGFLGTAVNREFGTLPFLFKVLAAAKPLSIQAHPNMEQARRGWDRENRRGIPPDGPDRNYRDPSHKPEILCALGPFKALCGFRPPGEIRGGLAALAAAVPGDRRVLDRLDSALEGPSVEGGLEAFLRSLLGLSGEARRELRRVLPRGAALGETRPEWGEAGNMTAYFAELYPGDPAALAPFYLNIISLVPGEAIYIPAGVLHAYVHGLGVELMANSDNVLRGGLTTKHMDVEELAGILKFSPFNPEVLQVPRGNPRVFRYHTGCREFSLAFMPGQGDEEVFPGTGPAILLVTGGTAVLRGGKGETLTLEQGESAFIPAGGEITLSGTYTLYAAETP